MIQISVHSQNLRGSFQNSLENITSLINNNECECTAILLQDIGVTGPDGPPLLHQVLGEHRLVTNCSSRNKTRTVAIIIHKSWEVRKFFKDSSGSLVGAVISKGAFELLIVSAYLPTGLDQYGVPLVWDPKDKTDCSTVQCETHSIYATLTEWTESFPYWLVGGDFNETRTSLDRIRRRELKVRERPKFIDGFLEETKAVDVWREIFPKVPGFTYRKDSKDSFSRLDYFMVPSTLFQSASQCQMDISNWEEKKDHCRINLLITVLWRGMV